MDFEMKSGRFDSKDLGGLDDFHELPNFPAVLPGDPFAADEDGRNQLTVAWVVNKGAELLHGEPHKIRNSVSTTSLMS